MKNISKVFRKAAATFLAAAVCVTSLPVSALGGTPAERTDETIVYFVDCGDYVVSTVGEGEQFGTHNSVTDQVYGADAVTGYNWGIVDGEELPDISGGTRTNGNAPEGKGVSTPNTWALEQLDSANTDYESDVTFRYSKNAFEKGYDERYVTYAFELEAGSYEVTVGCNNRWGCADSPVVTASVSGNDVTLCADDFTVASGETTETTGKVVLSEDGEMTVDVRGTGGDNLCAQVAYILIKSVDEGETEDEAAVRRDKEALTLAETATADITLPTEGAEGTTITWASSNTDVITNDGKVTRPGSDEEDAVVTLTATITKGEASDTKEFTVTVLAFYKGPVDRENNDIVYFVDCGDYVVTTVSAGDQFGTHNSVTEQLYGVDPLTGYEWGLVDTVSNPLKNGAGECPNGGFSTDWTWPYEYNTAKKDVPKATSNRYTKNQYETGIEERYLDYKFEIENGTYQVTVCCYNPWDCSTSPIVYANYGKDSQKVIEDDFAIPTWGGKDTTVDTVTVDDGELTINFRGTGNDNKAINVAYILIENYVEKEPGEAEKEALANDVAALVFENTHITDDLELETEGENDSEIVWESSNPDVIATDGTVTRPAKGSEDVTVTLTATVTNSGLSQTKKFTLTVLAESSLSELQEFALSDVVITDDYYTTVTQKDVDFLNEFDPDRLLYNFRKTAGYSSTEIKSFDFNKDGSGATKPYSGWENSLIAGHTLGHYIAAAAQAVADGYGDCADDEGYTLEQRLEYIIDNLEDCQDKLGTGFIFGAVVENANNVEQQFDVVEGNSSGGQWVPWYTMHKIVNGLVATYEYTGNTQALTVAESLGEWIYDRTESWSSSERNKVLGVEYGGMNDCLYELYKCAKEAGYADADHFADAAHQFDETTLFDKVSSGVKNPVTNLHANCTIPKFIGALNRYRVLGDEQYLQYAEDFWNLMINKHTYITGGNSECEFFGADNILDQERSNCNCETCNTHNMLRMTKELFEVTGDKKYADYYDTTFINAIMASVDEETGMTTYFQPMATGCWKVVCNEDVEQNYFWCCTGTGLENFTKLGDGFYFATGNNLVINEYISSKLTWSAQNMTLTQETEIPVKDTAKFTVGMINGKTSANATLYFRVPDWATVTPIITVNGAAVANNMSAGYIAVNRTWKAGDVVSMTIPMGIKAYTLPDNSGVVYGFKYGPVVLAAELGADNQMTTKQIGVQCDVTNNKIVNGEVMALNGNYGGTSNLATLSSENLTVQGVSVPEFIENIEDYLVRDGETLNFTLNGTDWGGEEALKFSPYYRIFGQRYGIYWLFTGDNPAAVQQRILDSKKANRDINVTLDGVGVGYGQQTEGNENTYPCIMETGTGSTGSMAVLTRYANAGGSFSYLFKVDPTKKNYLNCQYLAEDNGKVMNILMGGTVDFAVSDNSVSGNTVTPTYSTVLNYEGTEDKYTVKYEIPDEIVQKAEIYELEDATTGEVEERYVIRISFYGTAELESARLTTNVSTSTNYSNNAGITALTSDVGEVKETEDGNFTIEVPATTSQIKLTTTLADKYGLLYVDDVLTDDTQAKKITLGEDTTVVKLLAYAEDHETSKEYTVTITKAEQQITDPSDPSTPTDPSKPSTPTTPSKPTTPVVQKVTSIKLTGISKKVAAGKKITLEAAVSPANAANKEVVWTTSNKKFATVSAKGVVKTKKAGIGKTVTITATAKDGSGVKASYKIKIMKHAVKSVKITTKTKSVKAGKKLTLKTKVTTTGKSVNKKLVWSSSNTKYATVNSKGVVKTTKAGKGKTVKITVRSTDGTNKKATIKIKIK